MGIIKHNMATILYYTSVIHENIFILNKVCQVDVVFVPQSLDWINEQYLHSFGIKYKKLRDKKEKSMKQMMRNFNEELEDTKFKRCIILIMDNNDICEDTVYIFEPLQNDVLPPEIYN